MLQGGRLIDGKYRVVCEVGSGGMGSVYEAINVALDRRVAIKVLNPHVAHNATAVQRFEREAQAAARIGSPYIVDALDFGRLESGERYMVMELLDGESLADRLHRVGAMTPEELFPIAVQLLEGLGDAHAAGIVHRDFKPDNVFLVRDKKGREYVKILDFGVSKFMPLHDGDVNVTRTGMVVGTPSYMAPEQAKGKKNVDHRADLYAMGVVLFCGLSGELPFTCDNFNELMFKIVLEDAPLLSEHVPGVDPAIEGLVARALARDREKRFQSADEMRDALLGWMTANGVDVLRISVSGLVPAYSTSISSQSGRKQPEPVTPGDMLTDSHLLTTTEREAPTLTTSSVETTQLMPRQSPRRALVLAAAMLAVGLAIGLGISGLGASDDVRAEATMSSVAARAATALATAPEDDAPDEEPEAEAEAEPEGAPSSSAATPTPRRIVPRVPKSGEQPAKPDDASSDKPSGRKYRREL